MRLKRLIALGMAAVLIALPLEADSFLSEGLSIEASAAETQYREGFWTYVKHSDGTAGIAAYAGMDKNITIPSVLGGATVTKIENKAFWKNENIKVVNIPSTVSSIGYLAFAGSGITSITIPETITTWGKPEEYWNEYLPSGDSLDKAYNGAFAECKNLETVIMKSETVPECAFYECTKLKSVTLGEKTRYIREKSFYKDSAITTFTVKSNLFEIGDYAFWNCKNMKSISLGNQLYTMGSFAFAGSGLTSVTIPATVTKWREIDSSRLPSGKNIPHGVVVPRNSGAFAECSNLETVIIKSQNIPTAGFYRCTKLKSVTLGEETRDIEKYAFYEDSAITTFIVKSNLWTIERYAFWNCKNMKSISLGNELWYVGTLAFAGSGLTSVTIPETVSEWESVDHSEQRRLPSNSYIYDKNSSGAFAECDNLTEVNIGHVEVPYGLFLGSQNVKINTMKNTSAYEKYYSHCTLFDPIPATSVKFSKSSYTIVVGERLPLYPDVYPMNTTDRITLTSGNEDIAFVKNEDYIIQNVVKTKSTGLVAMKCTTDSGKTYTFTVNVVASGTTTPDTETKKNIALSTVKGITDKAYTGSQTTQSLKVMFNPCTELIPDVDYTVSYKNNVNIGTATVTITGKGSYTGTITKNYAIKKDDKIPEVTGTKAQVYTDRVTVSWKQISGATGYNIYVNGKKVNSKPVTDTTYTITGLSKNTSYNISITSVNASGESGKSSAVAAKTGTMLLGDISGDGKIGIVDAMKIFHYVSGRNKNVELAKGDINGDGKINIIDAMKVFHYVSGRNKGF